jgi:hypothetical protein
MMQSIKIERGIKEAYAKTGALVVIIITQRTDRELDYRSGIVPD